MSCASWQNEPDKFGEIVEQGLKVLGLRQRELADEFEVAISTISGWADGSVKPHKVVQEFVVGSIGKKARTLTR